MITVSEYTKQLQSLKQRIDEILTLTNQEPMRIDDTASGIHLVFAGQYSAGKSSIIKMLTNRQDIVIGAGITTQKPHAYEWNGIEIIDTPGIHTKLRPDHDELSYEAITNADVLVFVITNELFDSSLADHFRKLAIDKDKANEMLLVVNKMERTSEGNTVEHQRVIYEDLKQVLSPYTPEQFHLCFLDAESYLDSLTEEDAEMANDLRSCSGYEDFVTVLDSFIRQKGLQSKLTTIVYQYEDRIEKLIETIEPNEMDRDINGLQESILQQRYQLIESRNRLCQEVKDIFTSAASRIRTIGNEAAALITEGCNKDDVELKLQEKISVAQEIMDKCQNDAELIVDKRMTEIGQTLIQLQTSEFSRQLEARLVQKYDILPENIQKIVCAAVPQLQKAGQAIADFAYAPGINGGLKLACFAEGKAHDFVLKAGHAIGFKFKPWQAVKWARGIAVGAKALQVLGVALNVFMQIKGDHDEDQHCKELKDNRQNIRSQFNLAANELEDYSREYINTNVEMVIDDSIQELNSHLNEIRQLKTQHNELYKKAIELQNDCQTLIRTIHQS